MTLKDIYPKKFNLLTNDCQPSTDKYGFYGRNWSRFRSSLLEYYDLLCFINGKRKLAKINYPRLLGLNQDIILDKLKVLSLAQKNELLYIILSSDDEEKSKWLLFFKKNDVFRVILWMYVYNSFVIKNGKWRKNIKTIIGECYFGRFKDESKIEYYILYSVYILLNGYLFGFNKSVIKGRILRLYIENIYYPKIEKQLSKSELYDLKYIIKEFNKNKNQMKKFEKYYKRVINKARLQLKKFEKKYTKKFEANQINIINNNIFNFGWSYVINDFIDDNVPSNYNKEYLKDELKKFNKKIDIGYIKHI